MAILLTLLVFLLFISISYYCGQRAETAAVTPPVTFPVKPPAPELVHEAGFDIPRGYCFHPGHTWALEEDGRTARVGLDGLAGGLIGKIDQIEIGALHRWVRQGQKLWTVHSNGLSVDMVSPIEGIVVAANTSILRDPNILANDPYGKGWVLAVESPFIESNLRNLIRGPLARSWMQDSLDRLKEIVSESSAPEAAVAQDGRAPVPGLLARLDPTLQGRLVSEFFLT